MLRVYAQLRILFILFLVSSLGGCGGGSYGSYGIPWESAGTNVGVVTNDPNSIPDIAWQTPDQRQVLTDQNNAVLQQEQTQMAAIPPVPKPEAIPPAPHEKISVSLLIPLSGKKADLGQAMLKAAQMALFDVGGANLELVPRDTKGTTEGAIAAAQSAINGHSSLILGPVFAEDVKAVKPLALAANIPVISFTTDWTLGDNNTYIMGFLPFTQVVRVTKYAQEHGYSKLAVYAPQTEYCDVVIRTLQKSGVPLVHVNRYSPKQLDLSALVADFEKRFQEDYGTAPPRLSSLAYDATALASVLARNAQEGVSPYTSSALTNPRGFAGIDGIFRFRPDGLSERGLAVLEIGAGKPRVIDPAPTAFISSGT